MIIKKVSWLIFIILAALSLRGQQIHVSAEKKIIKIGEQTRLEISATAKNSDKILWPQLVDSLGEHFEIIEKQKIDTIKKNNKTSEGYLLKQNLLITSFDTGTFNLPPLKFNFISQKGDTSSLFSDSQVIKVNFIPVDTTKSIKDIKKLEDFPAPPADYFSWIIGLTLLGIISIITYYFLKRKNNNIKKNIPVTEVIPPWMKALREIDALEHEKNWLNGGEKQFFSSLSMILKEYIHNQFDLPAKESSTYEILTMSSKHSLLKKEFTTLEIILHLSDLVKFAKEIPLRNECENCIHLSRKFISSTHPQETIPLDEELKKADE